MILIAETAWHHDGDFDFFKKLITKLTTETKTDYIKLHITLNFDEYMQHDHPAYNFLKNRLLSRNQWNEIINIVLENGKKLMLLFNDMEAVDFGMDYSPELIEIHSVCLNDIILLKHLKQKLNRKTKIVLGVGGSTLYEIENAINILHANKIVLMHGFQNFPTKYQDINLGKIKKIMQLYPHYEHGYADHTAWNNENNVLITLFVAALGMDYIEKHVTTDFGKERTDWQAAISIDMFNDLAEKIKILKDCYGAGELALNKAEKSYSIFGPNKKAAILKKDINKGDKLKLYDFDFKRTGQNTDLSQIDVINLLGAEINKDLQKGHCIVKSDID